jgi:DNA modification methylase
VIEPLVKDVDLLIYQGDCLDVLREMDEGSADACVTSPPYLDARPEYPSPTSHQFEMIFKELRRVVSGPLLLNVGRLWRDRKELLWWTELLDCAESAGWPMRDTLIWIKVNSNPIKGEVLADSHEMVFMFGDGFNVDDVRTSYTEETVARMGRRWLNSSGVKGGPQDQRGRDVNPLGARPRSYLATVTGKEKGNPHPAPMALDLAVHLVKLGSPAGGTVLDPFGGSGNTAAAARSQGRKSILIELSPEYAALAATRLAQQSLLA